VDVRDKNHAGDTHKFFDHLDDDDDDHLTDIELMTILGADPKKPREKKGGMFTKIMDSMVEGMKKSIDTNGDGKVTKEEFHGLLHGNEA
jgi:Ca2+-binding EF-hand superfamily protein